MKGKQVIFNLIFAFAFFTVNAQLNEKKYLNNETYLYEELIQAYRELANSSTDAFLTQWGNTDAGEPLHALILHNNAAQLKMGLTNSPKIKMLVLNGIHAGESCGVDACLHWAEDLLSNPKRLEEAIVIVVPMYNIGGSLNRGCCTRANQNGPINKGFRGNANNLDLNRDFVKTDSENASSFQQLMQTWDPDVFMDTHSTNGADYQYAMTLIPYQWEKWPRPLQDVGKKWFQEIKTESHKTFKTQNYVNVWGTTPEDGFSAFQVSSLFSGGYAGLFRTLNVTMEAHMFKPFKERVEATINTLDVALTASINSAKEIVKAREEAHKEDERLTKYVVEWELDSSVVERLAFEGFEAEYFQSTLTGQERYRYNRESPKTFQIDFYPQYKTKTEVNVPEYYLLHKGNKDVVKRLKNNGVEILEMKNDTSINVTVDYVSSIKFANAPYEGHFVHSVFELEQRGITESFRKGDYLIPTRTKSIRYVLEVLEPQSPGSFFRWNFFDAYLQQKEWFSAYIFEEKAIAFLDENPRIKVEFESLKTVDLEFASNAFAQLYWIYKKSPYYEKEHMRIPVFKIYK